MNTALEMLLRELRLPTFFAHAQAVAIEAEREGWGFTRYLHTLAELEVQERGQRRIARRRKESKLPASKTLTSLDRSRLPDPFADNCPTYVRVTLWIRRRTCWPSDCPGAAKRICCARSAMP